MRHPIARPAAGGSARRAGAARRARWSRALAPVVALLAATAAAESPMPEGYPGRGRIGIEVQPMTAELREFFSAPPTHGVLIVRVEEGRPADVARLKVGDVVLEAAGEPLVRPQDLVAIVARVPSDEPLELTVVRKKKTRTIEVLPEGAPASPSALDAWHERVGQPVPALAPADAGPATPVEAPAAPAPLRPEEPAPEAPVQTFAPAADAPSLGAPAAEAPIVPAAPLAPTVDPPAARPSPAAPAEASAPQ